MTPTLTAAHWPRPAISRADESGFYVTMTMFLFIPGRSLLISCQSPGSVLPSDPVSAARRNIGERAQPLSIRGPGTHSTSHGEFSGGVHRVRFHFIFCEETARRARALGVPVLCYLLCQQVSGPRKVGPFSPFQ